MTRTRLFAVRRRPNASTEGPSVERLNIMTSGDVIDVADLPESVRSPGAWTAASAAATAGAPKAGSESDQASAAGTLREFKENSERMFLVGKLRENVRGSRAP